MFWKTPGFVWFITCVVIALALLACSFIEYDDVPIVRWSFVKDDITHDSSWNGTYSGVDTLGVTTRLELLDSGDLKVEYPDPEWTILTAPQGFQEKVTWHSRRVGHVQVPTGQVVLVMTGSGAHRAITIIGPQGSNAQARMHKIQ